MLGQYVEPGYCEPITELYQSDGWDKAFPKALVDLLSKDGKTYGVLAGVHRGNELWYNKKLLEKNGITIGETLSFDDFFAACDKLKAAGIPALGVGDSGIWASAQLFENTLLGVIGGQGWITGVSQYLLDPTDPFPEGFTVGDIWGGGDGQTGRRTDGQ